MFAVTPARMPDRPVIAVHHCVPSRMTGSIDNHHPIPGRADIDQHPQGAADDRPNDHPFRVSGENLPGQRAAGAAQQHSIDADALMSGSRSDGGQGNDQC
jgi:hypothetical protein